MLNTDILLIGCGKMGGALLSRLQSCNSGKIVVVDPAPPTAAASRSVTYVTANQDLPADFVPEIIILAIKPQMMAEVLPSYQRFSSAVFLSIAAGITTTRIEQLLIKQDVAVVRSMPNLPASVGQGATGAYANTNTSNSQKAVCNTILSLFGTVEWLDKEEDLDAVTALSGSGPAYIFALCEAMADAGTKLGLSRDLSERLARQTVIGSATLLAQTTESASTLRQNVTSPNGTTAAALKILQAADGLPILLQKTLQAAANRSRELAQ